MCHGVNMVPPSYKYIAHRVDYEYYSSSIIVHTYKMGGEEVM